MFRREFLTFPNARYRDQVDALTQFAQHIRSHKNAYLDTDPQTGQRIGHYRPTRPRREDRMRF